MSQYVKKFFQERRKDIEYLESLGHLSKDEQIKEIKKMQEKQKKAYQELDTFLFS